MSLGSVSSAAAAKAAAEAKADGGKGAGGGEAKPESKTAALLRAGKEQAAAAAKCERQWGSLGVVGEVASLVRRALAACPLDIRRQLLGDIYVAGSGLLPTIALLGSRERVAQELMALVEQVGESLTHPPHPPPPHPSSPSTH
jgi:hypothetical protein